MSRGHAATVVVRLLAEKNEKFPFCIDPVLSARCSATDTLQGCVFFSSLLSSKETETAWHLGCFQTEKLVCLSLVRLNKRKLSQIKIVPFSLSCNYHPVFPSFVTKVFVFNTAGWVQKKKKEKKFSFNDAIAYQLAYLFCNWCYILNRAHILELGATRWIVHEKKTFQGNAYMPRELFLWKFRLKSQMFMESTAG